MQDRLCQGVHAMCSERDAERANSALDKVLSSKTGGKLFKTAVLDLGLIDHYREKSDRAVKGNDTQAALNAYGELVRHETAAHDHRWALAMLVQEASDDCISFYQALVAVDDAISLELGRVA